MLKYDALAFGAADLRLGVQEVLGQYLGLNDPLKVVSANVDAVRTLQFIVFHNALPLPEALRSRQSLITLPARRHFITIYCPIGLRFCP